MASLQDAGIKVVQHHHPKQIFIFKIVDIYFMLPKYHWVWGHPLEHGFVYQAVVKPVKRTDSPLPRIHQLSVSPQLEMRRNCVHLLPPWFVCLLVSFKLEPMLVYSRSYYDVNSIPEDN